MAHTAESSNERKLDMADGLVYLRSIREEFQTQPAVYNAFLITMKQFNSNQLDVSAVVDCVSELLDGHPHLLHGFNLFLPESQHIVVPTTTRPAPAAASTPQRVRAIVPWIRSIFVKPLVVPVDAVEYVQAVKACFEQQPETYELFLEIIIQSVTGQINMVCVTTRVSQLFENYPELVTGFEAMCLRYG